MRFRNTIEWERQDYEAGKRKRGEDSEYEKTLVEKSRRIAIYRERAERGRHIFTGEPITEAED